MSPAMSVSYRVALFIAALLGIAGSYAAANTKYRKITVNQASSFWDWVDTSLSAAAYRLLVS